MRGYHVGQVYSQADGAWSFPARDDLDSTLGKIDPSLVREIRVVPGPYAVEFGPGLAFLDIVTEETPRYEDGTEVHSRTGYTFRGNGGQSLGHQTVLGGGPDFGFIVSYGLRTGSDYTAGNGEKVPSSYRNQNLLAQFGFDLADQSRFEITYQLLDQGNTEYCGQFFDIAALDMDAVNLRYVNESPEAGWSRLQVEGWFHRTAFAGNTRNASKAAIMDRVERALEANLGDPLGSVLFRGATFGSLVSQGARAAVTFGEEEEVRFTLGGDVRQLDQRIRERYELERTMPPDLQRFETNLPATRLSSPGLFCRIEVPWCEWWTTTAGVRCDAVRVDADPGDVRAGSSLPTGVPLTQEDLLKAAFVAQEIRLDEHWTTRLSGGRAERPPTPIERYADGLFLGILQSGFTRVIGNPSLSNETAWQADLTLAAEYELFRGSATVFHSWIDDYVTYSVSPVVDPTGARILTSRSTRRATLAGFELQGEVDLTGRSAAFGGLSYVDGRDRQLNAPLPSIAPLEGRLGVRVKDACDGQYWGLEFGSRIVDDQDRLGTLVTDAGGRMVVEQPTAGFATVYLRGYFNLTEACHLTAGVDNLFDRSYLEHLNLRLPSQTVAGGDPILAELCRAPGVTPYVGLEWTR